ncbi:hypothetical protein [Paenibacillus senegalensis]|uniref:hypothetical protein n=1 Tax=Paenibacillus senegalensis TaxID=1465766 RepID=UPI000289FC2A|nr:hypothetical protein [Paenibacillus senegalensis]
MKKSLSLLLAIAMVFSMFATVVSANPQTTMEKYEFLKEKGIFEGTDGDLPALDDAMTRAQFAKVLTLLNGLSEDRAAAAGYTDLLGAGWATGFIGAVTKAGLMEGTWDVPLQFTPSGEVKIEELAATLVRTFDLTLVDEAVNGKVSDWAIQYVATALRANLISEQSDYTVAAKRGLLVEAAYNAYLQLNVPAELSITDAKAVGAKKVDVTFNKAVEDASKIKLTLNRGTGNTAVTLAEKDGLVWNDAKTKATFTTSVAMTEGTYNVKLARAAEDNGVEIGTDYKDFSVQNERIEKIDFKASSDIIPQAKKVNIEFEAKNQYGEVSTLPASRFTIHSGNNNVAVTAANDRQRLTVNTLDAVDNGYLSRGSYLAITIVAENGAVTANKAFQIGDVQTVGKITLNELVLQNNKERLDAGDYAYITYDAQDQYGHPVTDLETLKRYVFLSSVPAGVLSQLEFVSDETGDNVPEIRITASNQYNYDTETTVHAVAAGTGSSSQLKLNVSSPKTPYEVSFGEFNETVAVGDTKKKYIPLVVKDQHGDTLSADDIVKAFNENQMYVFGHSNLATVDVEKSGVNKGKIYVLPNNDDRKGTINIQVQIPRTSKMANLNVTIQERRYVNDVYISSNMRQRLLPGSESSLKLKFKDQYGEDIEIFQNRKVETETTRISGDSNPVTWTANANNQYTGTVDIVNNVNDKNITFTASATNRAEAEYRFTARLIDTETGSVVDTATFTFSTIKAEDARNLTYELESFSNGIYANEKFRSTTVTGDTYKAYQREIKLTAKDSSGRTIAVPAGAIISVGIDNNDVANIIAEDGKFKLSGKKAGKVNLNAVIEIAGRQYNAQLRDVEVSEATPIAQSITAKHNGKNRSAGTGSINLWDESILGEIKVKDQYGVEIKNADLWQIGAFGVRAIVTNVEGGTVTNNNNGTITVGSGVTSFTVTVSTANGYSVTADVDVNAGS